MTQKIAIGRQQLEAFLWLAIEPLPAAELVDFEYNALARRARRAAWKKAELTTMYYDAQRKAAHAASCLMKHHGTNLMNTECDPWDLYQSRAEEWKRAVAAQIMTPAHQKNDVVWKRKQKLTALSLDPEAVRKMIEADEAFLAAHPLRRADVEGVSR